MEVPSLLGVMPKSEDSIAFSIALSEDLSQGSTTNIEGSGTLMPASCTIGVG